MLGNEELQAQLAGALESQVHSVRFDRFMEPERVVMLALFNLCHEASYDVYVANLADETNRIFRQNGETLPYSAKMVGRIRCTRHVRALQLADSTEGDLWSTAFGFLATRSSNLARNQGCG